MLEQIQEFMHTYNIGTFMYLVIALSALIPAIRRKDDRTSAITIASLCIATILANQAEILILSFIFSTTLLCLIIIESVKLRKHIKKQTGKCVKITLEYTETYKDGELIRTELKSQSRSLKSINLKPSIARLRQIVNQYCNKEEQED